MIDFFFLIPVALGLGLAGLASFMWTMKSGQYDDLEGAAERILFEGDEGPLNPPTSPEGGESAPELLPQAFNRLSAARSRN